MKNIILTTNWQQSHLSSSYISSLQVHYELSQNTAIIYMWFNLESNVSKFHYSVIVLLFMNEKTKLELQQITWNWI